MINSNIISTLGLCEENDLLLHLISFSEEWFKKNNSKEDPTEEDVIFNGSSYVCRFFKTTSTFEIDKKEYKCTFTFNDKTKTFDLSEINGIKFHKYKYVGVLNTWCDIDNNIDDVLKNKQFTLNNKKKKFNNETFNTHIAYVFYIKLFNEDIGHPYIKFEENHDVISFINKNIITNEYFGIIDDIIVMDSLLFYKKERVYCVFKRNNNKAQLVQLCTNKDIIWGQSNNTDNLIQKFPVRPKKTIEIGTGSILFKKTKKDSMNINKFYDHLFEEHWNDRLSNVFNEYKDYNGISESNMTEEKKVFIKELFKKGLIRKIRKEVDENSKKESCISGEDLYIYINNKNPESYYPDIKICFFMPIDFCGKKYYIVISYNKKDQKFSYETLYTEEMRNNQIMPYESLRNKIM